MSPRTIFGSRRGRIASWAKWICLGSLPGVAWFSFAAFAEGPQRDWSQGVVRSTQQTLVQLGFVADEAPPAPPATLPNAPRELPPAALPSSAPTVPFPQPQYVVPQPQYVAPHPQYVAPLPSQGYPQFPTPPQPAPTDDEVASPHTLRHPWWEPFVTAPMRRDSGSLPISVEDILVRAIRCASQVRVFSDLPLIRETAITEADAAFDWTAFLETRWQDLNDPVGNTLTVGDGSSRYINQQAIAQGGLRKRTREGGSLQLSQQFGWQETNSIFFVPSPQGTARLVVGYTHPLLRGSGQVYNESLIVLAQLDTAIATDEFSRQLQSHLLEVLRSYWGLYLERANLAQKLQSLKRASETLAKLKQRQNIDAVRSQILRARAEVGSRRSQVLRAEMGVKNAEDRLRALVNDPDLGDYHSMELLPTDAPMIDGFPLSLATALGTAVQTRPEVNQALRQIQAGCTRLNMSQNEVLPMLNLVTEAYVAGLEKSNSFSAYGNQFDQGRPGYTVGLQFEVPLGNRAAKARLERRELELRQLRNQYQTTLNTLQLEVKVSVREVETAQAEMHSQHQAMDASTVELDYLEKRWEHLPGEDGTASLMLDNLLDSQNRLAQNEFNFLTSQVTYNLAMWNVKKATGELLQTEQVSWGRTCVDGLPTLIVDKYGRSVEVQQGGTYESVPLQTVPAREPYSPQPAPDEVIDGPMLNPASGTRVPSHAESRASWWQSAKNKVLRRE